MSKSAISKDEALNCSIQFIEVGRVYQCFNKPKGSLKCQELINNIIRLYNDGLGENKPHYGEIADIEQPNWEIDNSFKLCAFTQHIPKLPPEAKALKRLGTQHDLNEVKNHHIFFLYRSIKTGEEVCQEIFALTSGQTFHIVRKFCDYKIPIQIIRRLYARNLYKSTKRPLVGLAVLVTEIWRKGTETSMYDAIDKFYTRLKFDFRSDSSIFGLNCFQAKKKLKSAKDQDNLKTEQHFKNEISVEIGLGRLNFSRRLTLDQYPELLNHLSEVARKETREEYSRDLDFLEYFQPTDFLLAIQLTDILITEISGFLLGDTDKELPPLDFCHKNYNSFFNATEYKLMYDKDVIEYWGLPPLAKDVLIAVKKKLQDMQTQSSDLEKQLKKFTMKFKREGEKPESGKILDFFEGQLYVNQKDVYWRLKTIWYEIKVDYLSAVHQIFIDVVLKKCMLTHEQIKDGHLPELWPKPLPPKMKNKKDSAKGENSAKVRQKKEEEYNKLYFELEDYCVGDKICPYKIELFDIMYAPKNDKRLFLYQVKEGFDHSTRDACSQILNAAKKLHAKKLNPTFDILEKFYKKAKEYKGDKEYRLKVQAHIKEKFPKQEDFEKLFSRKINFVYAFADEVPTMRLLQQDRYLRTCVPVSALERIHKKLIGKEHELFKALVDEKYLSENGHLTSKFYASTMDTFDIPMLTKKIHKQDLYRKLSKFQPQFKSTISKLELIALYEEFKKLGFKLKICQISRKDYDYENYAKTNPNNSDVYDNEDSDSFEDESSQNDNDNFDDHFKKWNTDSLPKIKENELPGIKNELREGKTFKKDGKKYNIDKTLGDGACGLHALIGKKVRGIYKYVPKKPSKPTESVREAFIEKLKTLDHPVDNDLQQIKEKWIECKINLLKDYEVFKEQKRPGEPLTTQARYPEIIFDPIKDLIKEFQDKKAIIDQSSSIKEDQEDIFSQIVETNDEKLIKQIEETTNEEISELRRDSNKLSRKFRENFIKIIDILTGSAITHANSLFQSTQDLNNVNVNIQALYQEYVEMKEVNTAFYNAYSKPGYFFSSQEIGIAAWLFKKRVVIYEFICLKEVQEELVDGDGLNPKQVIFHKQNHYSHCTERSKKQKKILKRTKTGERILGSQSDTHQTQDQTQPCTQGKGSGEIEDQNSTQRLGFGNSLLFSQGPNIKSLFHPQFSQKSSNQEADPLEARYSDQFFLGELEYSKNTQIKFKTINHRNTSVIEEEINLNTVVHQKWKMEVESENEIENDLISIKLKQIGFKNPKKLFTEHKNPKQKVMPYYSPSRDLEHVHSLSAFNREDELLKKIKLI